MWYNFLNLLEQEMKVHPRLLLLLLLTVVGVLGYSYATFAQKLDVEAKIKSIDQRVTQQGADLYEELRSVNLRLTTIEWTQEQRFMEQRLATTESEIYQLERLVARGDGTERDQKRLDNLKIEFNQLTRKLEAQRRQTEARLRELE